MVQDSKMVVLFDQEVRAIEKDDGMSYVILFPYERYDLAPDTEMRRQVEELIDQATVRSTHSLIFDQTFFERGLLKVYYNITMDSSMVNVEQWIVSIAEKIQSASLTPHA